MKIIVSDFDNTLFNTDINKNVEAIKRFVKNGNLFIIATGRPITYLNDDIASLDIPAEYYICNDGSIIFDKYLNVLYRKDIEPQVVEPIFNMLKEDNNIIEVFVDTSHGFISNTNGCANGIVARPFDKIKSNIILSKIVNKYPSVHGYISTNWININDATVSKSEAIKYLVETYNYKKEDIYTIGDGTNDLSMIQDFNGYTLPSGNEDVKSKTNNIVKSVYELIEILEKN